MMDVAAIQNDIRRRAELQTGHGFIDARLAALLGDYNVAAGGTAETIDREIQLVGMVLGDYSHCHTAFRSYTLAQIAALQLLRDVRNSTDPVALEFKADLEEQFTLLNAFGSYKDRPFYPAFFSAVGRDALFARRLMALHVVDSKSKTGGDAGTQEFLDWAGANEAGLGDLATTLRLSQMRVAALEKKNQELLDEKKRLAEGVQGAESDLGRLIDARINSTLVDILKADKAKQLLKAAEASGGSSVVVAKTNAHPSGGAAADDPDPDFHRRYMAIIKNIVH
jgi:hypothetical protein